MDYTELVDIISEKISTSDSITGDHYEIYYYTSYHAQCVVNQ
jgi:hypothetical protein